MKKLIFMMSFALMVLVVTSCNNEDEFEQFIAENPIEDLSALKKYFVTDDFSMLMANHHFDKNDIAFNSITHTRYDEYYVDSYIVPVLKQGKVSGNIIVNADYKSNKYHALYMDLSDIHNEKLTAVVDVTMSDGSKLLDFSVTKESDKLYFELNDACTEKEVKDRPIIYKAPGESFLQCTKRVYSKAREACDANSTCRTACDAIDFIGGACTGQMLGAAAAACAIYG